MVNDPLYIIVLTFSLIAISITTGLFITSYIMKDSKTILFYLATNLLILNNLHSLSYINDETPFIIAKFDQKDNNEKSFI